MEEGSEDTTVEFEIQYVRQRCVHSFPLTSTIGEVKEWLCEESKVLPSVQLLLLNAPVAKPYRKIVGSSKVKITSEQGCGGDGKNGTVGTFSDAEIASTPLSSILTPSLLEKIQDLDSSHKPQCIKVRGMLIGCPQSQDDRHPRHLTAEAAAALSRIVSTTLEDQSNWYRCSYSQGYVRQTAYVCRTCLEEGRAAPDHAICFGCAEICHAKHNVEEWGTRFYMRCDCCTSKCWRTPPSSSSPSLGVTHSTDETSPSGTTPETSAKRVKGKEEEEDGDGGHLSPRASAFSSPPSGKVEPSSGEERSTSDSLQQKEMKEGGREADQKKSHSSEPESSARAISLVTTGKVEARMNRKRARSPLGESPLPHAMEATESSVSGTAAPDPLHPPSSSLLAENGNHLGHISNTASGMSENQDGASSLVLSSELPTRDTLSSAVAKENEEPEIPDRVSASQIKSPNGRVTLSSSTRGDSTQDKEIALKNKEKERNPNGVPDALSTVTSGVAGLRTSRRVEGNETASEGLPSLSPVHSIPLPPSSSCATTTSSLVPNVLSGNEKARSSTSASHYCIAPSFEGCRFILDSETHCKPTIVIPPNTRNRYPRRLETWCYCEENEVLDKEDPKNASAKKEEKESDAAEEFLGLSCMLCSSCFWSDHVTSLYSDQLKRVSCYKHVNEVDVVVFYCITCETFVCPPCRYRCHKDHEVEDERILSSVLPNKIAQKEKEKLAREAREMQELGIKTENKINAGGSRSEWMPSIVSPIPPAAVGAYKLAERISGVRSPCDSCDPGGVDWDSLQDSLFTCGCRGMCRIKECVSPEEVDDPNSFLPIPNKVAIDLMINDGLTGFVCSECMQENPWLLTQDLRECMNGTLPPKATDSSKILPILPCKTLPADHAEKDKYYPYHGMLLPIHVFSDQYICSCQKCQAAFHEFAPWGKNKAQYLMMNLFDQCNVCKCSIGDQDGFLCKTCEMVMTEGFLICSECNAHRVKMVERNRRPLSANELEDTPTSDHTESATNSSPFPSPSASSCTPGTGQSFTYVNSKGVSVTYEHDLSHQFLESTLENLYALCGMQIIDSMEQDTREYLLENIEEINDLTPQLTMQSNFGPQSIEFTQEELKAFAIANAPQENKDVGRK